MVIFHPDSTKNNQLIVKIKNDFHFYIKYFLIFIYHIVNIIVMSMEIGINFHSINFCEISYCFSKRSDQLMSGE